MAPKMSNEFLTPMIILSFYKLFSFCKMYGIFFVNKQKETYQKNLDKDIKV